MRLYNRPSVSLKFKEGSIVVKQIMVEINKLLWCGFIEFAKC